jgi:hypothetical protein
LSGKNDVNAMERHRSHDNNYIMPIGTPEKVIQTATIIIMTITRGIGTSTSG